MRIDETIKKLLCENEDIKNLLAEYHGEPAIFLYSVPEDFILGSQERNYPYITLELFEDEDVKRKNNGSLHIKIYSNAKEEKSELLEAFVRGNMSYHFIYTHALTCCFRWYKTKELYHVENDNAEMIKRLELKFDKIDYCSQETLDPDPVVALNKHLKMLFPELDFLGTKDFGETKKLNQQECIVYCSLVNVERGEESHAVTWMEAKTEIHILCPDLNHQNRIAAGFTNVLASGDEINTLDGVPLFIKSVQTNLKADKMIDGQIIITLRYGLTRYTAKPHIITGSQINYS